MSTTELVPSVSIANMVNQRAAVIAAQEAQGEALRRAQEMSISQARRAAQVSK